MKYRIGMLYLVVLLWVSFTMAGCGGGGGGENSNTDQTPQILTGQFIDSPVEGLSFQTATQSGTTDAQGTFQYQEGEMVDFYLGSIFLGQSLGTSVLSPLNLVAGATDETDPAVINILRLLQTLDDDGYPVNGITLLEGFAALINGQVLDFTMDPAVFDADPAVVQVIAALTGMTSAGERSLVSVNEALDHFREQLGLDGGSDDPPDDDGDGFTEDQGDCDDGNSAINPNASETCGNGVDEDCNGSDLACPVGSDDIDDDGDGYTENQGDCDDGNSAVNPNTPETCGNGIDDDCDGIDLACAADPADLDNDGDHWTENEGDCDDGNSAINPWADEICGNGIDEDCNGIDLACPVGPTDQDNDNDGFTENQGDCDDDDSSVSPGNAEVCADSIDNNCNDAVDENCSTLISNITFDDANLQDCVELESLLNNYTYVEEVTNLNCNIRGIVNLDGLENFVNLELLYLTMNNIVDLAPLAGLSKLTLLILGSNEIVNITPLAGLSSLTLLDISLNQIESLNALSGLTGLDELYLKELPGLSNVVPLYPLTQLTTLHFEGSDNIPCSQLDSLEGNLGASVVIRPDSCDNPPIADISFADANLAACVATETVGDTYTDQVTNLSCTGMSIVSLDGLEDFTNLNGLYLGNNIISDLDPLAGLTKLRQLALFSNDITDIQSLNGLTSLTWLNLGWNNISDITPLYSFELLTELDLDANNNIPCSQLDAMEAIVGPGVIDWTECVDDIPPTVVSFEPTQGSTNASITTNIVFTFSELLAPADYDYTYIVMAGAGTVITGVTSFDTSNMRLTFNPDVNLMHATPYTIWVKNAFEDMAGNNLQEELALSFTTF